MRLIDADELKKNMVKICKEVGKAMGITMPVLAFTRSIDNAPTFEEKPKSKWIAREDMNFLDENKVWHFHFMCEKCGFIHDFIDGHTSQYNFCPNCGAKVIKEDSEA